MLNPRLRYLQIAFNRSLPQVEEMIGFLPSSDRILIEAGTPLIKRYGVKAITYLKQWWSQKLLDQSLSYIVADLKCMDRGSTEVEAAAASGASAATCLGLAPIETIKEFIKRCQAAGIDAMIDMMNVEFPFEVLQKLRPLPKIVVLHRGVDENENNREKQLPLREIHRIKGTYPVMISVAGGETFREVQSALFNDADIAVTWKEFYKTPEKTAELAQQFLETIK